MFDTIFFRLHHMRGKVKYVQRSVWYVENSGDHWSSNSHPRRETNTYAVLYDGTNVNIDEDDIRDYYDRQNITNGLIKELSDDLHNVWIEFSEGWDGDYWMEGELEDFLD
jgi:hypothetical protein